MDKPLISVILPVYNVEAYFPKCMESLFVQTYGNLEFVVVDDGSNEKCRQLFDEYSKKIQGSWSIIKKTAVFRMPEIMASRILRVNM